MDEEKQSGQKIRSSIKEMSEYVERAYIIEVLNSLNWKMGRVAKILQIDRSTLFRKMKKYGIEKGGNVIKKTGIHGDRVTVR